MIYVDYIIRECSQNDVFDKPVTGINISDDPAA
jgi:hypothetical protein